MPIKWKSGPRFKPGVILKRVRAVRTVSETGQSFFVGFDVHECTPALQSMLSFPDVAENVDRATLVWNALSNAPPDLSPETFLVAINRQLDELLATKIEAYCVLTTISLLAPRSTFERTVEDCQITFLKGKFPAEFAKRESAVAQQSIPVKETRADYCRVIVRVHAKSPQSSVSNALRALDLQRAVWCLYANSDMEIAGQGWKPINVVKLGPIHTVHLADGELATKSIWFEPNYAEVSSFDVGTGNYKKLSADTFAKLQKSNYRRVLVEALLKFVRALDERDQNTAFLKLWGAAESLLVPDHADYEKFVRRCSFLYKEREFHMQLLEHLREYRNTSVHAGDESDLAKTHCFQLQAFFRPLMLFHLHHSAEFSSLSEANDLLDLSPDPAALQRKRYLLDKAILFVSPPANS